MNEHISVMTDFGELIATPFAGGISVDINLPDGKGSGQLAFIESTPAELQDDYPTPVHVFSYDGRDSEPVHRTDVHLDGDARLYGKCSEVHGSVRRQAPHGDQVCGGPGEGRAGPQECRRTREGISRHPRGRGKEIGGRRHSRQPPRRSRKDDPLAGRHRRPSA